METDRLPSHREPEIECTLVIVVETGKQLAELSLEKQVADGVPAEVELVVEVALARGAAGVAAEHALAPDSLVERSQAEDEPLAAAQIEVAKEVQPVRPLGRADRLVIHHAEAAPVGAEGDERRGPDRAAGNGEAAPDVTGAKKRLTKLDQRLGSLWEPLDEERDVLVGDPALAMLLIVMLGGVLMLLSRPAVARSWLPRRRGHPHHTINYFYANGFYAIEDYRAAALDPTIPGPLARVGILFEGTGLGDPGALSPTAGEAVGGAFGHQRFFGALGIRQQLLFEGGGRYSTQTCSSKTLACSPHQVAVGRRGVIRVDGFAVRESLRGVFGGDDSVFSVGARAELLVRF